MPKALALRLRANLAREAEKVSTALVEPVTVMAASRRRPFATPSFLRQAAAMAAVCVVSALVTWWVLGTFGETSRLEQDVLAAHMRSLLQDSPIQVASSDSHTVKPWFAGRIDFAPDVKDLSAEGFPLIGGRLDYVSGRRVVAVVYKRRLHTVNVFMWPSTSPGDAAPRLVSRNGYNLITWSRGGTSFWAVSDLSAGDLSQLQGLL
jgi:anti-sigma factor RsiW